MIELIVEKIEMIIFNSRNIREIKIVYYFFIQIMIISPFFLLIYPSNIIYAQNFQKNMTGKDIYISICSSCHGINGNATLSYAPNFVDGERLDKDIYQLVESVREGLGRMPPQNAYLSENQIVDVIKYAKTLKINTKYQKITENNN